MLALKRGGVYSLGKFIQLNNKRRTLQGVKCARTAGRRCSSRGLPSDEKTLRRADSSADEKKTKDE